MAWISVVSVTCSPAIAQPAAAPSTSAAARRAVVIPPGFKVIVVSGHSVICQADDEQWIRQAVASVQPATKPSTMPADLLERLTAGREMLAARMSTDLALKDPAEAKKFIDEQLVPVLKRASDFKAPLFYLVTTEAKIKTALQAGWEDPQFRYARASDSIQFNPMINLSLEGDADDQLIPSLYKPEEAIEVRAGRLTETLQLAEQQLSMRLASRSQTAMVLSIVAFIGQTTIDPLKLTNEQQWFGVGVAGVLSAEYLAIMNGQPAESFLALMNGTDPRNPIRQETIDLLHPVPPNDLRPAARPAYTDSLRRKSATAVQKWLASAPKDALPKTIQAIRDQKPADGAALVKVIKDTTGVDVSEDLKSR